MQKYWASFENKCHKFVQGRRQYERFKVDYSGLKSEFSNPQTAWKWSSHSDCSHDETWSIHALISFNGTENSGLVKDAGGLQTIFGWSFNFI